MKPAAYNIILSTWLFRITLLCCFVWYASAPIYAQPAIIPSLPLANTQDLDTLIKLAGNARIVVLGEASHGTSEYYQWRAAITKRLIEEKGFNCVAVEGEWADCYRVNAFVKGPSADTSATIAVLQQFGRWPTWMWANHEMVPFISWLNHFNQPKALRQKVGFYGLDLYCVRESINELLAHAMEYDSSIRNAIVRAYNCLDPYGTDAMDYARGIIRKEKGCGNEAGHLWGVFKNHYSQAHRTEEDFAREQYALVVEDGERYFHNITSGAAAWNLRENHMYTTIRRLLDFYGPSSRIIVWAHNTHTGDARSSTMSTRHKISLGQILRQAYGDNNVFLVGIGSYSGSVLCGKTWGDTMRLVTLPPARPASWEDLLHTQYGTNRIILSNAMQTDRALNGYYYTRAVGAIYQPTTDAYSSYTASIMARRYDAFIYLDKTTALHPLPVTTERKQVPFTYPTGF